MSDFVSFFTQMHTSEKYYSTEEVLNLGDNFVKENGTIDIEGFS